MLAGACQHFGTAWASLRLTNNHQAGYSSQRAGCTRGGGFIRNDLCAVHAREREPVHMESCFVFCVSKSQNSQPQPAHSRMMVIFFFVACFNRTSGLLLSPPARALVGLLPGRSLITRWCSYTSTACLRRAVSFDWYCPARASAFSWPSLNAASCTQPAHVRALALPYVASLHSPPSANAVACSFLLFHTPGPRPRS